MIHTRPFSFSLFNFPHPLNKETSNVVVLGELFRYLSFMVTTSEWDKPFWTYFMTSEQKKLLLSMAVSFSFAAATALLKAQERETGVDSF